MARYFTSDWHFDETRIGSNFNPFFRPFASVEEQNEVMLQHLNDVVGSSDELIFLGDAAVTVEGLRHLNRIRCRNRTLVIGNYDDDKLDELGKHFDNIHRDLELDVAGIPCYLNHYPINHHPDRFNIVGHIHGLWKVKPNMVNVGVDAWHFRPVPEEQIAFVHTAIQKYYDANVFVPSAYHP